MMCDGMEVFCWDCLATQGLSFACASLLTPASPTTPARESDNIPFTWRRHWPGGTTTMNTSLAEPQRSSVLVNQQHVRAVACGLRAITGWNRSCSPSSCPAAPAGHRPVAQPRFHPAAAAQWLQVRDHRARPGLSALAAFPDRGQRPLLRPGRSGVRRADHIIAVSESTKNDLVQLLGAPPEKITVVYEAADPLYRPMPRDEALGVARAKFPLPEEFILFVSTIEPRKNIGTLLRAYRRLRDDYKVTAGLVLGRRSRLAVRSSIRGRRAARPEGPRHFPGPGARMATWSICTTWPAVSRILLSTKALA